MNLIRGSFKKAELLVPALGVGSLLTAFLITCSKKYFLADEVLSYYLVTDPSLSHMIRALADQVDVSPPVYYVFAWLWVRVFGDSEVSLRVISFLGMGFAFVIIWMMMRRYFGFWATSIGVSASFFFSVPVVEHISEARFYGLFLALGALAFLQYDRIIRKGLACSWKDFFGNAGIHAGLVLTHNFGLLYSGMFLLAYLVTSVYKKTLAPKVYLSLVLGWAAFLPWLSSFLHQAEVGNPHSYIPVPGYRTLLDSFSHGIPIGIFVIMLFFVYCLIAPRDKSENNGARGKINQVFPPSLMPLFFLGVFLVVIPPIVVWIISRLMISVFEEVYMIPSTLGWSILLTWLVQVVLPCPKDSISGKPWRNFFLGNRQEATLSMLILCIFMFPPASSLIKKAEARPGSNIEQVYADIPVVVEYRGDYLPIYFYSYNSNRYYFILDLEVALNKESCIVEVDSYYEAAAIKRHYHFFNVMHTTEFIRRYSRFLILHDNLHKWFELRIKNNPDFTFVFLKDDLILVERKKIN
jgi:uncharacterized membrane protein